MSEIIGMKSERRLYCAGLSSIIKSASFSLGTFTPLPLPQMEDLVQPVPKNWQSISSMGPTFRQIIVEVLSASSLEITLVIIK